MSDKKYLFQSFEDELFNNLKKNKIPQECISSDLKDRLNECMFDNLNKNCQMLIEDKKNHKFYDISLRHLNIEKFIKCIFKECFVEGSLSCLGFDANIKRVASRTILSTFISTFKDIRYEFSEYENNILYLLYELSYNNYKAGRPAEFSTDNLLKEYKNNYGYISKEDFNKHIDNLNFNKCIELENDMVKPVNLYLEKLVRDSNKKFVGTKK